MPEVYDDTEGDDALAAGLSVMDGGEDFSDVDAGINKTRDMIAHIRTAITTFGWSLIGAASAAAARGILGLGSSAIVDEDTSATGSTIAKRWSSGAISVATPGASNAEATNIGWVNSAIDAAIGSGGLANGPTNTAYARNATGPGTWYTVWMNSANQFMRNTSSRRYKKNIRPWAAPGFMSLRTVIFDRRGNDTPNDEVGFIAEEVLEAVPDAVVYYDGKVDGISDRALLAATVAHLQDLTRRVDAFTGETHDRLA